MLPRLVVSALAGLALAAAFPPVGWWPLVVLAPAAWMLAVRGTRGRVAAALGLAFGATFTVALLQWLRPVGPDAWLMLAALQTVFFAGQAPLIAAAWRMRAAPFVLAATWVLQEAIRGNWPLGGFPWGRLALGAVDAPVVGLAALGGAPLVTFGVALASAGLAGAAVALRPPDPAPARAAAALGLVVVVPVAGALAPGPPPATREVTVAVVQGGVPGTGLDFLGRAYQVLDNHAEATHRLAAAVRLGRVPAPDLVVWPENSSDVDPLADPRARATIQAAIADVGRPTLVGALVAADGSHVTNSGIVWDPVAGPGMRYDKRQLVPFGEYVPFRELVVPLVSRLDRVNADKVPGDRPGGLDVGPVRVGLVICFEITYDRIVRDAVRDDGRVLVVQTNNATFAGTGQTQQQLDVSRLRAIEHGRDVVVAATSGVSAVIGADGTVRAETAESTQALLVEPVAERTGTTLATRLGALPALVLGMVGTTPAVVLVRAARARRRSRAVPR